MKALAAEAEQAVKDQGDLGTALLDLKEAIAKREGKK